MTIVVSTRKKDRMEKQIFSDDNFIDFRLVSSNDDFDLVTGSEVRENVVYPPRREARNNSLSPGGGASLINKQEETQKEDNTKDIYPTLVPQAVKNSSVQFLSNYTPQSSLFNIIMGIEPPEPQATQTTNNIVESRSTKKQVALFHTPLIGAYLVLPVLLSTFMVQTTAINHRVTSAILLVLFFTLTAVSGWLNSDLFSKHISRTYFTSAAVGSLIGGSIAASLSQTFNNLPLFFPTSSIVAGGVSWLLVSKVSNGKIRILTYHIVFMIVSIATSVLLQRIVNI